MTYYEFNPFTGRLKESTKFQPYYPLKPSALNKADQKLIWDIMATKTAEIKSSSAEVKAKSLPGVDSYRGVDPKLVAKYKFFQRDLSKPVYLMGGTKDRILFGVTIAITCLAAADVAKFLYEAMKKG
ncbi:hypothetical protein M0802_003416 [Mischocyttarus mexicanus]|nr:hypothetical protein M0802_003416 [Mischocyttarus mexicanus]